MNPEDTLPIPASDYIRGASSPRPDSLPTPTDSPVRKLNVFNRKKIMISDDLELGSRLKKTLEDLIEGGGGHITTTVHKADIFICHWRDGRDYVFASRAGIDIGNLSWLYHLITHNEWTSPLRRLLHYPLPRNGIPGFQAFRITLSNYGGEARTYLENLVNACGGEFTKSMKQDNTHLITARKSSEKCNAADEWNISMVNHLWIEESYARCEVQKLTDPRYTHFPPRTNLGEIIGQTQFDANVLSRLYFPRDPTPSPNDPKPLRRPVMHEKDQNASKSRKSTSSRKSDGDAIIGGQDDDAEVMQPPAPHPRSKSSVQEEVRTPAPSRRISAAKENDTPSSTGSRSAKDKAVARLTGLAPDIALYEKEKKRKGPLWGGERALNRIEKEKSLERSSSPAGKPEQDEFSDEEGRTPKRQRTGLPPVTMRLLITGYKGWIANPTKEDLDKVRIVKIDVRMSTDKEQQKKLREARVLVVQDPTTCTHLAAPAMVRTQKFLCALAVGPIIVSTDFIDACIKKGDIPKVDKFLLKDQENEKKFNLKLADALHRARANKRYLLRRVPIYCTAEIPNGPDTYKSIVEANGGTFYIYRGRPTIKKTAPEEDEGPAEPVYLITGQRPDEKKLWPKFTQMAEDGNMIPRIVSTEWLLDVAMSQQHKWSDKYLAVNDK